MAEQQKTNGAPLLSVQDLSVTYSSRAGVVPAVRKVSFSLEKGESLGLVGESGCGKSTLAFAVMNYLGRSGSISGGQVLFKGRELAAMPSEELRLLRGGEMAMVYQDPMSCLNPVMTIGRQLMEVPLVHQGVDYEQARQQALDILTEVALPDPPAVLERYPHQLSGGQQQRVLIGMSLMSNPELLVMDEPTTGLDVTIEAAILELVAELRKSHHMALLFISHNLGTVMRVCDRIGVMYCGELVEEGEIGEVFQNTRHPYTRGLLGCLPSLDTGKHGTSLMPIPGQMPAHPGQTEGCVFALRCNEVREPDCTAAPIPTLPVPGSGTHQVRCVRSGELPDWKRTRPANGGTAEEAESGEPLLEIVALEKSYLPSGGLVPWRARGEPVRALNGVSLTVYKGQTLAIVGESGCGKSTLAKVLTGLEEATEGSVKLNGIELAGTAVENRPWEVKKSLQMVFQNPDGTLNPSHTVGFAIGRSLRRLASGSTGPIRQAVQGLLRTVNLPAQFSRRLPRQLSGGQIQRVAIARALAGSPQLVVADEPVSSLDVSVQAAIINLLLEIQAEQGTTMLFISHDLAVVRYLADRVAVMYLGKIMECGKVEDVFEPPYHPYTEALLSSAPVVDTKQRRRIILEGDLPSPTDLPKGCPFYSRCPRKLGDVCADTPPPEHDVGGGHRIACHIPLETLREVEPVFVSGAK
ncbi:MAG: ABC transporter ATP-binding protein [SAR324 cluster bacterium]|nr:ABC transporter ATP-binding protein [SAR324 cluster bacterium]